jgi:hypothetical protein
MTDHMVKVPGTETVYLHPFPNGGASISKDGWYYGHIEDGVIHYENAPILYDQLKLTPALNFSPSQRPCTSKLLTRSHTLTPLAQMCDDPAHGTHLATREVRARTR